MKRFLESETSENLEMVAVTQAAFTRIAASEAVFIAHIAGHAMGGGLEIALGCDLRYASEGGYRMACPEVALGLLPGTVALSGSPAFSGQARVWNSCSLGGR